MVPTMFSRLLKLPDDVRAAADLSSLECIIHAAAPCPVPVKQQMIEWFGPKIIEYYGATEANGFTFCSSEEWLAHPGTVGKCILGELLILDEDGNPQPTGTPGTVWFKGATNFEYFHAPDKTAESRNETGDASTVGDVGYLDEDGYLYLTDRKTYMIISGGVNIYPQETENLLITHPKVMDAAVFGVPNEDLGEEVKAVVQPMEDIEAGPELERELIAFCRENLAHFKCPRTIDFEDELPRLPTGKLYKRLLRDRYWEGHATRISLRVRMARLCRQEGLDVDTERVLRERLASAGHPRVGGARSGGGSGRASTSGSSARSGGRPPAESPRTVVPRHRSPRQKVNC